MTLRFNFILVLITLGVHSVFCTKDIFSYDLSVHVLDTSIGRPAGNVPVTLYKMKNNGDWTLISNGKTQSNGRYRNFSSNNQEFTTGTYKLSFETKSYYGPSETLYPVVDIIFDVDNAKEHYHIPLLISGFGYSTYRGQ